MPHSSGGGSSGGGFHSSSSSGGGRSGPRYSNRPFVGGTAYVYYYGREMRPRMTYCSEDPRTAKGPNILSYIFIALFAIIPVAIIVFFGFHNPQKLSTSYASNIDIDDRVNVLSTEEETSLKTTFNEFYEVTGISPYLLTIDNASWSTNYASLEDYAYRAYLGLFNDESHWLIVYAGDGADPRVGWKFEGMQGNNTDNVLTVKVTDKFNETAYNNLKDSSKSVSASFQGAFEAIMPGIMDKSFYLEPGLIVFSAVWFGISCYALVSTVMSGFRIKAMRNAVKAPEGTTLKTCARCGAQYYDGTLDRCPKCGNAVPDSRFASFGGEKYDPSDRFSK